MAAIGAFALVGGWATAAHLDPGAHPERLGSGGVAPVLAAAAPLMMPVAVAAAPEVDPALLGTFLMTRYYVAEEFGRVAPPPPPPDADGAERDDAILAEVAPLPPAGVTIYDDRGCRPLATLTPRFTALLDTEGTGKLRDGRVINVSKACSCGHSPCYRVMAKGNKWGMSAIMRPLQPFRTVSVDPAVIKLGSIVYIEELDGLTMPGSKPWGGFVHDGCVIAADVGGNIDGKHLDFFVGRVQFKHALDRRKKMRHVTVYDGATRCADAHGWVARRVGS